MSEGWEVESLFLFIMSPLIGVLASSIGCAMMDAAGHPGYTPLYVAAREGAIGSPIAALVCVLITATLTDESALTEEEFEMALAEGEGKGLRMRWSFERAMNKVRLWWTLACPYIICFSGPPIGAAILQVTKLSEAILPMQAVRGGAVGGVFATPIYYGIVYAWSMAAEKFAD